MRKSGSRSLRDCVVWAVIIGGHALLIFVFSGSGKRHVQRVPADEPSLGVLVLLDMPSLPAEIAEPTSSQPPQQSVTPTPAISTRVPRPEIPPESTAITLPAEAEFPPPGANVDWQAEAGRAAQSVVKQGSQPRARRFFEQPVSPFREKPKPKEFEWDPEPKRAGLAGGFIPYVRINKRCVVGLGFFGCALGKLPEANSHLLDDMYDPERPRSSVPDIDTSSALDPPVLLSGD